jgi:hypothetical protein
MERTIRYILLAGATAGALGALSGCGEENGTSLNAPPSAANLGGFNIGCGDTSTASTDPSSSQGQQQKNVPFQQQQSCVQQSSPNQQQQQIKFVGQKVADFDVKMDCVNRVVRVASKGKDKQSQTIPIQSDGTVKGALRFKQEVADDGKGTGQCWLEYVVNFDGKATCDVPAPTPSSGPSPSPSSSPNPAPTPTAKKLDLTTQIDFAATTLSELERAGVAGPGPSPTPAPTAEASPTPSPSPSPSPSMTPSPTPTPTFTVSPAVKVCKVENPCPIEGKTDVSCGQ